MKVASFVLGEAVIVALLAGLLFVTLLWQPVWMWFVAPSVVLGGFVGIVFWAETYVFGSRILVFLCPISYTVWLVALGVSLQSSASEVLIAAFFYYILGVTLLWLHQKLIVGYGRRNEFSNRGI